MPSVRPIVSFLSWRFLPSRFPFMFKYEKIQYTAPRIVRLIHEPVRAAYIKKRK